MRLKFNLDIYLFHSTLRVGELFDQLEKREICIIKKFYVRYGIAKDVRLNLAYK